MAYLRLSLPGQHGEHLPTPGSPVNQAKVLVPLQGYAYTIPSPYAIYNPALSAAYTAALQALQAAAPPAPGAPAAAAGPSSAQASGSAAPAGAPGAAEAPLAAFNAALQTLRHSGAGQAAAQAGPSSASASAAGDSGGEAGAAAQQPGTAPAAAAAAPAGALGLPPLALPMAQIAYVPAFIPIPQPVLTAMPNPQLGHAAAGAEGQAAREGQPGVQPALVQVRGELGDRKASGGLASICSVSGLPEVCACTHTRTHAACGPPGTASRGQRSRRAPLCRAPDPSRHSSPPVLVSRPAAGRSPAGPVHPCRPVHSCSGGRAGPHAGSRCGGGARWVQGAGGGSLAGMRAPGLGQHAMGRAAAGGAAATACAPASSSGECCCAQWNLAPWGNILQAHLPPRRGAGWHPQAAGGCEPAG